MNRSGLRYLALFALLGVAGVALTLYAQAPAPRPPAQAGFTGKVILVEAEHGVGNVLEQPEFRTAGGRAFVVGKSVKDSGLVRDLFPGATMWIPVEKVVRIVEADDLDKLKHLAGVR